ncbi:hypothetical protein ACLOJK_008456 [Asimina triloba]
MGAGAEDAADHRDGASSVMGGVDRHELFPVGKGEELADASRDAIWPSVLLAGIGWIWVWKEDPTAAALDLGRGDGGCWRRRGLLWASGGWISPLDLEGRRCELVVMRGAGFAVGWLLARRRCSSEEMKIDGGGGSCANGRRWPLAGNRETTAILDWGR